MATWFVLLATDGQVFDHGEPGLLILSVPAEFSASSSDSECFAIPVMSRNGGFLLCIPRGVISEDTLIDCMSGDDTNSVLGPSKGIPVQLQEEGEEQAIVPVPGTFNVLLVDFADDALGWLRDYDPSVEILDGILAFSADHPFAIPVTSQLVPIAQEWVGSQGSERANFYSAQEEQEPPPKMKATAKNVGKAKGTLPKRVTNAQMLEQMEAMVAQMKALSLRTEMLEQGKSSHAKDATVPGGGNISGVPAVSAGLGIVSGPPATAFAKYTTLVGPPPKVRGPARPCSHRGSFHCPGIVSTNSSTRPCVAPCQSKRPSHRYSWSRSSFYFYKRCSEKGKDAARFGHGKHLLPSGHAAAPQEASPFASLAEDHGRAPTPFGLDLPREVGRFQACQGLRAADVVDWICGGCGSGWRFASSSREVGFVDGGSGSERGGWRLDDRLLAFFGRRSSDFLVPGVQEKSSTMSPFGKPFSSLVPPQWSSVVLAFIKEMEVLQSRKPDSPKKTAKAVDPENPSPRRKPRFPKRPRQDADPPKGQ